MVDKLMSEVIIDTEMELYQVAGVATQVYSQDIIAKKINDGFLTFFDDKDVIWDRFTDYTTYTLNGTTGYTTVPVSTLYKEADDVLLVYPSLSDSPLTKWNKQRNPALITGSQPLWVRRGVTDSIRVLPITATGNIVVLGKQRPANWPYELDQTVEFDYLALSYYAAWQIMVDDGTNPDGAAKLSKQFTERYKTLIAGNSHAPIALNGRAGQIPQQWYNTTPW